MINKNANWKYETGATRPTLYRGDWFITQVDVAEYILSVSGYKGARARCKTLEELQALAEDFVNSECGACWLKKAVPAWIPREPSEPWVQTQLP